VKLRNTWRLCGVFLLAIEFCGTCGGHTEVRPSGESVLVTHFETVFSTETRFLRDSQGFGQISKSDLDMLRTPFDYLLKGLDALGNGASTEILGSGDSILVGAKDFLSPAGLGPVHSTRCYIVTFKAPYTFDFRRFSPHSVKHKTDTKSRGLPTVSQIDCPLTTKSRKCRSDLYVPFGYLIPIRVAGLDYFNYSVHR
jgi:hypothetical protein